MKHYLYLLGVFIIILSGCSTSENNNGMSNITIGSEQSDNSELVTSSDEKQIEGVALSDEEQITQVMATFYEYFFSNDINGISSLIYEYNMPHIYEQTIKNTEVHMFSNQSKFIDFMIGETMNYGRNGKRITVALKVEENNQVNTVHQKYSLVKIDDQWRITSSEGIKHEYPAAIFTNDNFKLEIEETYYSITTMYLTVKLTNLSDHIIHFVDRSKKKRGGFKNSLDSFDENNFQIRLQRSLQSPTAVGSNTEVVALNPNMINEGQEYISQFERDQSIVFKIPVNRLNGPFSVSGEYEMIDKISILYVNQNADSNKSNQSSELELFNDNGEPVEIIELEEVNIEI